MSFLGSLSGIGKSIGNAISGAARAAGDTATKTIVSIPPDHARTVGTAVVGALLAGYEASQGHAPVKGK